MAGWAMTKSPEGSGPAEAALWLRWESMRARALASLQAQGWSRADAEDLFGQALVRAWESRGGLRRPDAAESWFWTVLKRSALDQARREQRALQRGSDRCVDDLPAEVEGDPPCACSLRALGHLPDSAQHLVRAVDVEGLPVQVVAAQEGITPNAASVRLHRARRALRDRLAVTCGTTSVAACMTCGCEP